MGDSFILPPNGRVTFKALGRHSEGRVTVVERLLTKDAPAPPHIHSPEDEAFYVVDGEVVFNVAGETFMGPPGAFLYVPSGMPIALNALTDEAKLLIIYSPGGYEHFIQSAFT